MDGGVSFIYECFWAQGMWFGIDAFLSRFREPFSSEEEVTARDRALAHDLELEEQEEEELRRARHRLERDLEQFPDRYAELVEEELDEEEELLELTHRIIEDEDLAILYDLREPFRVVQDHIDSFADTDVDRYLAEVVEAALRYVDNEISYFEDLDVPFDVVREDERYRVDAVVDDIRERANTASRIEERTRAVEEELEAGHCDEGTVAELCEDCIERVRVAAEIIALATLVQRKLLDEHLELDMNLSGAPLEEQEHVEEYLREFREEDREDIRSEEQYTVTVRRYVEHAEERLEELRDEYAFGR